MRNAGWRALPLAIFLIFLFLFAIFEFGGLISLESTREQVLSAGPLAGVVILVLLASDLIAPLPSSVLMTLAGSLYGTLGGALVSLTGSLAASLLGFYISRTQKERVKRIISREEERSMEMWFRRWGEGVLILSRMVPIVTETMSTFAGLTRISFPRFLALILIGTLPVSLYYSYFGSRAQSVSEWSLPLVAGVSVPGMVWIMLHFRMKG